MAAARKRTHDEFKRELPAIRQRLTGRPGCGKAFAALAKIRGYTAALPGLVAEIQAAEAELRASLPDVKAHDPELARGLSKLCDVAACADFLTPEEMLEKLEFLKART
jgi:hypothetical protein